MIFFIEYDTVIEKRWLDMKKAIFSKIDLTDASHEISKEFNKCIIDLIYIDDIQNLRNWTQHCQTTRYQHSINVAYYSFLMAKKLGLDAYSCARAGLLHDLYFYDWKQKESRPCKQRHSSLHPQLALENAKKHCDVNLIMEDAILHHMWPMTLRPPKTKEGWLIQAVDKYCAVLEIVLQGSRRVRYSKTVVSFLALFTIFYK